MTVTSSTAAISGVATQTPNTSASSAASSTTAAATLGYNQFLQLLVAELKNQDPTSPTDPTQFISQLSSFSAVEQQVQTNSTLDALLGAQANGIIGKTVTSADGTVSGRVTAVTTSPGGQVTATLVNGLTLSLGNGVTVSQS